MFSPLAPLRERIANQVRGLTRASGGLSLDIASPPGDPGLFGPDAVCWRVHADFPAMMAGGISALLLQTLHPRALAGVWDHSNFRDDLVGRLRRTTSFVSGTTYAPREQAQQLIDRVKAIHAQVHGQTEDGRPYAADDPVLLTWVHVTEAYSFLQGYRRYSHASLPAGAADRYYDEVRRVAEALGAKDVPASEAQVTAYFHGVQPQLRFDHRSREVLDVLSRVRLPVPAAGLSRDVFLQAGAALLPAWATTLLERTPLQQAQARLASRALWSVAPIFRAALHDGIAARACARVGVASDTLQHWPRVSPKP